MSKAKLLCTVALGVSALSAVLGVLTAAPADEKEKDLTNETERYPLVNWDFNHVEIPYVICLWILLASVAKMGKFENVFRLLCIDEADSVIG